MLLIWSPEGLQIEIVDGILNLFLPRCRCGPGFVSIGGRGFWDASSNLPGATYPSKGFGRYVYAPSSAHLNR